MHTPTSARLELLSATVQAIAKSLSAEQARHVGLAVRSSAASLSDVPLSPAADAALAGELMGMLTALSQASGTGYPTPACEPERLQL